jgi:hypothetical protein
VVVYSRTGIEVVGHYMGARDSTGNDVAVVVRRLHNSGEVALHLAKGHRGVHVEY